MVIIYLIAALVLGFSWGAYDGLQLRWRNASDSDEFQRIGVIWHRVVWIPRILSYIGLPILILLTLPAWQVALAGGILAFAVFDIGHNVATNKPISYIGSEADTDKLLRKLNISPVMWLVLRLGIALTLAILLTVVLI